MQILKSNIRKIYSASFLLVIRNKVFLFSLDEKTTDEECQIPWKEAFNRYKDIQFNVIPRMSLKQWMNMWGRLCLGSAGISDFPIWVQLLPELFFEVADRDGNSY